MDGNNSNCRIEIQKSKKYLLCSDDHQFSPLHWAAKQGHSKIVDMLLSRGARVHTTNMGDDTPLHLAAAHGHEDIVVTVRKNLKQSIFKHFHLIFFPQLLKNKAVLDFVNEHGNTPLHYACFWNFGNVALELVEWGALVTIQNKYGESPLDKASSSIRGRLQGMYKIC